MASSRPSFPAPSEPNLRRLGVGGSGGGDRPIRAQLVVAAVVLLMLVAIPLYVFKSPSGEAATTDDSKQAKQQLIKTQLDASAPKPKVELGPVQRVKCSASPAGQGNEGNLCDALPQLEKELARAIIKNVECAPKTGKSGSINFVLTVDFTKQRTNVFPGASGQWKGPQAKAAAKCVKRSFPEVKWDTVPHRYRYYMLAILASYPAPDPLEAFPDFE